MTAKLIRKIALELVLVGKNELTLVDENTGMLIEFDIAGDNTYRVLVPEKRQRRSFYGKVCL